MHRRYEPIGNNCSGNNNPSTASGQNTKRTVGDAGPYTHGGQGKQWTPHPSKPAVSPPVSPVGSGSDKAVVAGNHRPQGEVFRNKSQGGHPEGNSSIHKKPEAKNPHPVTKFIPQSVYNPQTGKVLGFLSAEDLLILGLIFLLLDSGDECEDNSMLIYALLYILISEHMDLPF